MQRAVIVSPFNPALSAISNQPASLRPDYRLHKAGDFAAVFSYRRAVRGNLFHLHYRPNGLAGARIGFVVAKKLAKHAVLRNLIKRIGREAFRLRRSGLPRCDLVLRLVAPPSVASRRMIRSEMDTLLDRLPRG
ncbi:MAG: ribonuclease P protein component [Betaproteobacteria bacterium]|nr:ribonuclease P protein component [Betaproteobacteria bacterium]